MSRNFRFGTKRFQDQAAIERFLQASLTSMKSQLDVISIDLEFRLDTHIGKKPGSIFLFWHSLKGTGLTVFDQRHIYERLVEMISGYRNLFIYQADDQGDDPNPWIVELRIDDYSQFTMTHHNDDDEDLFFPTVTK
jgi:hypothetical protein